MEFLCLSAKVAANLSLALSVGMEMSKLYGMEVNSLVEPRTVQF